MRCETESAQTLKHMLREGVSRTERALRQSQRVAEQLSTLRLLAASREQARQVERRDQRL